MKKSIISVLLATSLFASCTKSDDNTRTVTASDPVSFGLGFMRSDGEAELFDHESKFANVAVAVFTKGGTFHSVFAPAREGDNYAFDLEEGNWKFWVLANALTPETLSELLTPGVSRESDLLELTVENSLAKDRRIPMVSASAIEFYRDPARRTSLGEIEMERLAARIDVVNAVDELTVTRVVMKSRTVAGTLGNGGIVEGTSHIEDVAFNDLGLEGSSTEPTLFTGNLYSYHHPGDTNAPTVEVHYTYFGEQYSKEFAFDGSLVRNHLYSIQLVHRGSEIDHRVQTWGHGGRIVEAFSPNAVANRKLAINHFMPTNVKTLAGGVVTFCADDLDPGYSSQWSEDWGTATYTDAAGNEYRVPTLDEMRLIAIGEANVIGTSGPREVLDVQEALPNLFGVAGSGGNGTSDYWVVRTGEPGDVPYHTVYAIRFKNTRQVAAYRYRFESNSIFSVRVKALGIAIPTKEEVCDEAYWAEDHLEFIFPINGTTSRYWTADVYPNTGLDQAMGLVISNSEIAVTNINKSNQANLRLVRVN